MSDRRLAAEQFSVDRPNRFQILSLDGGGLRGLFTARVLAALEQDLGTSVADHFDLIAGTSTGAIIALGLGFGVSTSEIVRFYEEEGPRIFPSDRRFFRTMRGLFYSKYSSDYFVQCLHDVLGERTLGQSLKALVIPTYNLDEDKTCVLKTPHHPSYCRDRSIHAWKVAVATTAAPTYFPASAYIDDVRHVDGGVWANNPSLVGVIEAHKYCGVPLEAIRLLSIGTGRTIQDRSRVLDRGGRLAWGVTGVGVDVLMRAQGEAIMNQVRLLLGSDRTYRVNPLVPKTWQHLDVMQRRAFAARASQAAKEFAPTFDQEFCPHRGLDLESLRNLVTRENGS